MPLRRIAVLVADDSLSWVSCQSISMNLKKAYREAFGSAVRFFSYPVDISRLDVRALAGQLKAYGAERVVFLDHLPHPVLLLCAMHEVYGRAKFPELVIHAYGDFSIYPFEWLRMEPFLAGKRALLVASSPRQAALVGRFVESPEGRVVVCPFPVDAGRFHPSSKLRREARRNLRVPRDGSLIAYAGRLSLQKNIVPLIRAMTEVLLAHPSDQFVLAGPVDDLGTPLFEPTRRYWHYHDLINRFLRRLPEDLGARIRLLGDLEGAELNELYNAADVYVSMSLHHDEDFGMAPAEALLAGCPVALTDWGGYGQFGGDERDGALVPVRLENSGLKFKFEAFKNATRALAWRHETFEERLARARRARARFSIEAVAARLVELHEPRELPRFKGFSRLMRSTRAAMAHGRPAYPQGPRRNSLYEKVYTAYLAD